MNIVTFVNELGIGGTEKAACRWARGLVDLGHEVHVLSLENGSRRAELEASNIDVHVAGDEALLLHQLRELRPEVIHVHAPGHPHRGDILGDVLASLPKIPVVQTNVFGHLENPKEEAWTDFRLFISWTSCVQAARRSFKSLNEDFFKRASVAIYPVDADDGPPEAEVETFRRSLGIESTQILFGRLSRPEPNKWNNLPIRAFRKAAARDPRVKLLLREPPPDVARELQHARDRDRFVILPTTSDPTEFALTIASLDVILHTSSTGESFGYGIAEPMNYGKPVITNSTPWLDQAQIELVRHDECGFIASTSTTIAQAMQRLARDADLRCKLGRNARSHIRALANPKNSLNRLESMMRAATSNADNPYASEDLKQGLLCADYLDAHQFGNSLREQIALRPRFYWTRFHQWRGQQRLRCVGNELK